MYLKDAWPLSLPNPFNHMQTDREADRHIEQGHHSVCKEPDMVALAHTIIDPWAMMIEAAHALIAYVTVTAPVCPNNLTFRTQVIWIEYLKQFEEVDGVILFHIPRVLEPAEHKKEDGKRQ
jgi:hypothetical protein